MNNAVNILLPIAGNGSRFFEVGYKQPKPLIKIPYENKTILQKSLESIKSDNATLIFIVRQDHVDIFNIDEYLIQNFGKRTKIIISPDRTDGAVCSCLLAEEYINNENPLIIFTPDCYFEPCFNYLEVDDKYDGAVGVFYSDSEAHSYVTTTNNGILKQAAEKQVISHHAVGGLYYYKKGSDFVSCSREMLGDKKKSKGEYYICPVFNYMIKNNKKIIVQEQTTHHILGTPRDLETYIKLFKGSQ